MDDFSADFDYLNNICDAQMFQRAPWPKFERLDPFEYYDDAEFWRQIFTQEPYLSSLPKLLTVRLKKWMLELQSLLMDLFLTFKSYKLNLSAL